MASDLPIDARLTLPGSCLRVQYSRSGGPGGQHVNRTESRVQLFFDVDASPLSEGARRRLVEANTGRMNRGGELVLACDTHRERGRNLDEARARLAELVRASLKAPRKRRPTRPTRASKERRLQAKGRRSRTKAMRRTPSGE